MASILFFSYMCSNDHHYKDCHRNSFEEGRKKRKRNGKMRQKKLKCSKKSALRAAKKQQKENNNTKPNGVCSFCVHKECKWQMVILYNGQFGTTYFHKAIK